MSELLYPLTVVAGLAVGFLSALFGVGGGILMVPYMVLVLNETQHLAEGTSLLVIVPTAIVGVASHYKRGFVSVRSAAFVALGGVFGSIVGARVAIETHATLLQALFGGFVILVGIRFIYQGFRVSEDAPEGPRSLE